ncbi:putative lipoprotein [Cellvibrio sp. BR]|jgi:hypothetical protein|uniref:hypothetical protein n=1 Tax=unclassified Cellvibrio TaxID=2624793 RepID=UPI00026011F3|nr:MULTISPECIES: hypothetical protein [unclassified Cellvibrio]EIK45227.1 putative lipoprotein [Cellvibrio sp. BR]UUA73374.1 hypothetical protein NNX04_02725 [Cellvibrio sp. QJXJ]
MKLKNIFALNVMAATLAACGGGDINLNPSNTVIDSNNTVVEGGPVAEVNPCAKYTAAGQVFQGIFASGNCTYAASFVSDSRPLTEDLFIPELANNGLHIFEDSLFVGEDVNASAAASGIRVPQDGEGPTLTIAAGAKLAFSASEDYVRIARGSRIVAEGTAAKPIVFSSVTDLRDNAGTEADRGLWGGVQINGNGLTNKCSDAERQPSGANPHNCHATAEGRPAAYGGNNNAENSGSLRYVVIKHAGYEVVEGSELNGLTLNAVGSGTRIEYVQTYTTQDDGFEMFGGAVDLKHVVGVNVGDDTFDFSEGWTGNIQFALSVATSGGNTCVEADNTGSGRGDGIAPLTKGRISNLTCLTSNVDAGQGDQPSSKGDSEGPVFREGAFFEMYNSIVTSSADGMSSNECLEIIDSEGPETIAGAKAGWSVAASNFIACTEALKQGVNPANSDFSLATWLNTAPNANNVVVNGSVAGTLPVTILADLATNNRAYITAAAFADGNAAGISIPAYDVTRLEDEFEAGAAPALGSAGSSSFFTAVDFIGAVKAGSDWTEGWTVGLSE